MSTLRRRLDKLAAARPDPSPDPVDAWLRGLSDTDLDAVAEVVARVGDADVAWRGDAAVEAAFRAVEDAAAGVRLDDAAGPFHDAGVRAAARRLVEVVRERGFTPWGTR